MAKPVPKKQPTRADIVDELGDIQAELGPKKKREAELINEIRSWAEVDCKPAQNAVYEGRRYVAPVTAKPDKRTIPFASKLKMLALFGKEKFCELAGITLEAAQKNLTAEQFSGLIVVDRNTGTRSVTTAMRMPAAAKRAA